MIKMQSSKTINVWVHGIIDENTFKDLKNQIKGSFDTININIDSEGGYVYMGRQIYTYLERLKNSGITVNTIGWGLVCSAATFIFLAGESRKLMDFSQFLIHCPVGEIKGNAEEIFAYAESVKKDNDFIANLYSQKTGKSIDFFIAEMKKDTIMTPQKALEIGFATEIENTQKQRKAVAFWNKPEIKEEVPMKKINLTLAQNLLVMFGNMTKHQALVSNAKRLNSKNLLLTDKEGNRMFVYSDDESLLNYPVVLTNEDGTPTDEPAGNGDYEITTEKGEAYQITILDGVITVANEKTEDMQKPDEPKNEGDMQPEKTEAELAEAINVLAEVVTNLSKAFAESQKEIAEFVQFKNELQLMTTNHSPKKATAQTQNIQTEKGFNFAGMGLNAKQIELLNKTKKTND